jgi:hypothetical protein
MKSFLQYLLTTLAFTAALAAHAETSMLRVACEGDDVGAEVSVNGKFRGECPLDIQVAPGTLKLRVEKKDSSYERIFEQEIRMGDGVVKKVEAILSRRLNAEGQRREDQRMAEEAAHPHQWADADNGADINWNEATQYCTSKGSGWRLPTSAELQASSQSGHSTPCGAWTCKVSSNSRLTSAFFWSSEPNGSAEAWLVSLFNGNRAAIRAESRGATRALCVRQP